MATAGQKPDPIMGSKLDSCPLSGKSKVAFVYGWEDISGTTMILTMSPCSEMVIIETRLSFWNMNV